MRNKPSPKDREVTFLSAVRGKVVLHRYDYTSEERVATWYANHELEEMRKCIAATPDTSMETTSEPDEIEPSFSEDSSSSFSSMSSTSSFSSFRALRIKEPPMIPRKSKKNNKKKTSSTKDTSMNCDSTATDAATTLPRRPCLVKRSSLSSLGEENHDPTTLTTNKHNQKQKKNSTKVVTFARSKIIRPSLHRNHYTPAERRAVWYNKDDLLAIKRDNLQTIKAMMALEGSSSNGSPSSLSNSSSEGEFCTRGLEKQTRLGTIEKTELKRIAREAVFEEQAVQKLTQTSTPSLLLSSSLASKLSGKRSMSKSSHRHGRQYVYDHDAIAKVYRIHTRRGEEEAFTYAIEDELAASMYLATVSPKKSPTSSISPKKTSSSQSRHHQNNITKHKSKSSTTTKSSFMSPRPTSLTVTAPGIPCGSRH